MITIKPTLLCGFFYFVEGKTFEKNVYKHSITKYIEKISPFDLEGGS